MKNHSFTDEQLLNLINNTIKTKSDFDISKFTGGGVQITSTYNHKIIKYKIYLTFGYDEKRNSLSYSEDIEEDISFIWQQSIMLKVKSLQSLNTGSSLSELNKLMNTDNKIEDRDNKIEDRDKECNDIVTTSLRTNNIIHYDDSMRLATYLLNKIKSRNSTFKEPNLESWAKDIDLALRVDKRTASQLKDCIDWIYTSKGEFWQKNILSGKKLREKFDAMNMQVISHKPTKQEQQLSESAKAIIKAMQARGHSEDEIREELRKIA